MNMACYRFCPMPSERYIREALSAYWATKPSAKPLTQHERSILNEMLGGRKVPFMNLETRIHVICDKHELPKNVKTTWRDKPEPEEPAWKDIAAFVCCVLVLAEAVALASMF